MVATVTSLTSAAVTTRYFERDGYYAKSDPEHRKASRWHGEGAAALGLGRQVAPSRFEAVLAGEVPGTEITLGRIRDGKREHRPGLDVTMQAPKSVSLAALVAGDGRIVRAHDEAVRATLDFVERHLLATRQWDREGKRHVRVPAPSMVAATFRHKANRNLEPHLHTHAVIANMTRKPDGTWASLDTGALGRSERLIGAHYRNELAARLLTLGYELRPSMVGRVPGFEIEGYGRKLLEENSSRRQEIVAWVRSHGLANTAANRQRAALATRKTKDEPHHRELEAGWRARAAEMGLDRNPPRPEAGRRRAAKEAGRHPTMLEIVNRSAEHLAERASVFREADLCTLALAHSPGLHTHADYRTALDGMKRDGHLVDAIRGGLGPCLVTSRALRAEREIVERMRAARETGRQLADAGRVETALGRGPLTEGQREAVRAILLGNGRIAGVQGYAGTGKTAMLRAVRELAEDRGVIALAPSAAAVRSLRREAGLPARTMQGFLSRYRDVADGTINDGGLARLKALHSGSVLVLDEASMAGTVQMRSLMRIADALDVGRLVLVGDTRQLRAIEAGQPFRQLQEAGMPTAVMDDVLRQRTPHLREAVAHVIGGRPREALGRLGDDVHEVGAAELGRTAARLWLDLDPSARAATAILAPTHGIRAEIAATVREGLAEEGVLKGKEIEIRRLVSRGLTRPQTGDVRNWDEGDAAVFHHDIWGGKAKAGEVFTVDAVDGERAELVHEDGRVLKVKPGGKLLRYQLELHETATIRLRAGDEIRWTRNDNRRDLVNGGRARVLSVGPKAVRFRTADGRGLKLSRDDPQVRHIDHAYSATVHGAQGTTADRVIAVLDSGHGALADQATFYVEVTRARDEAVILTDNREQLAETLEERTGLRMTALEAVGARVGERERDAVPDAAPAPGSLERAPEVAPGIALPDKAPVRTVEKARPAPEAQPAPGDLADAEKAMPEPPERAPHPDRLDDLGERAAAGPAAVETTPAANDAERAGRARDREIEAIERDWRSRRAKAATQDRDIAFLPGTEALLWRSREFEERHPGALPKATADLARDCESVRHRWKRFEQVTGELADFAKTPEPPGEDTCKAMAEAERLLADGRLTARALDLGALAPMQFALADLNERRAYEDRFRDLRKERDALEAEAERQGCHPFHMAGHRRLVERLAGFGPGLPPDLAGMVDELPGLEARDRGIRRRVGEVTNFDARRRKIVERAARWRPDAPLDRSRLTAYGRWAGSAPKVVERAERLAGDPLVSPDDRKALEKATVRIRDTLDACGIEARHLRAFEGIRDRAEQQGCHRFFVEGYDAWVDGLGRRAIRAPGGNEFAIRERSVRDDMQGAQAILRCVERDLDRVVREREEGGGRFAAEMHPYARWERDAERHVGELRRVLADGESYGPHLARVPGLEKRLRDMAATVTDAIRRDAPVRKEVEAAHKARMEREMEILQREQELERIRSPSRSMSAEIDIGR
ncbi:MAG: relaxase domain-containing protein [Boseongicola sp. SB0677_bin_26]|nr:relaxase domain-containing protein [Boseongicola sp. SB0665_bin_10]MYG24764.1 relaxase domain-containing protein [Boseongicola sp. SB0677_bin_26]